MNNLFRHRRILLPSHCFNDQNEPLNDRIRAYLAKSYKEVKFIKTDGKFAICEGR